MNLARWLRFRLWLAGKCFIGVNLNTIVFFDGQNIYRSAKDAWRQGNTAETYQYTWPSYDVQKLSETLVSKTPNHTLSQIRFYTGVPDVGQNQFWHDFWINKIKHLEEQGIEVYKGRINSSGQEKGVDVKMSVDIICLTYERQYEVALMISQDRDFEPAIRLAKEIAKDQHRQLIFESHFIVGVGSHSDRGIPGTIWKPIDKATYDTCLDAQNYREP